MSRDGFVEVSGGGRLWYEESGSGSPVVLVHGGLVDSGLWDPQMDAFAARFRAIRYDMRGFGRSSPVTGPCSFSDDLRDLLAERDAVPAAVVGLSMGGALAIEFAIEYPNLVRALVLVGPGLSGFEFSEELRALDDEEEKLLADGDVAAAVERSLRTWTDGPRRTPDRVEQAVREKIRAMTTALYSNRPDLGPVADLDPPAAGRLGEIAAPTLVLHGEEDVADVFRIAETLEAGISGAKRATIPRAAHHPNLERPAQFNEAVLAFLASL